MNAGCTHLSRRSRRHRLAARRERPSARGSPHTLSRAKFDVTQLDTMSDANKQSAMARMNLPSSDIRHMPPALFRTLPDAALKLATDALK